MDRPRELLQAVDEPRAVAMEQIAVDRAEPPGLDGGQLAEVPPLFHGDRAAVGPMIRQQNHLRTPGYRRLETVAGISVGVVRREGSAAGELDELGDDRPAPWHDERLRPEHVEDARAAEEDHGLLHRRDPLLYLGDER